ncbi:MAG: single-stranded-DNA-specific exonuclease RecJ [Candidatus Omnitrophota bacterium]|nr:MAG: single-stranded-DNA-specific exonuclease RecJ [Candidatus Omnitrophota bacterium]
MKEWRVAKQTPKIKELAEELGLSPILSQLLLNRGITDLTSARKFLYPQRKYIYSPFLLPDLEKAVLRLRTSIERREKILLFGDYDVDGVTSLAMLSDYLFKREALFKVMIPSRIEEGYGFNEKALTFAKKEGISLIISLDCGSNCPLLNQAVSLNKDVIVIDHHELNPMERSFLLINPKRKDISYPFRDISSGVVTFKFIWALKGLFPYEYLDLVALSIVCDVMPLMDENRILLKEGLEKLRLSPCLGVQTLIKETSLKREFIDTFHLGWILGPRLNASGRVSSAYSSFRLLRADSPSKASELVSLLEENNQQRKLETEAILNSALSQLKDKDLTKEFVIVLADETWHIGVLGIAASRLKDMFVRPVFLFSLDKDTARGSARSIESFNLIEALEACRDFVKEFGGHRKACGLEIEKKKLSGFKSAINNYAKKVLREEDLIGRLFIDKEISFSQIDKSLLEYLKLFPPYGEANPQPLFISRGVSVKNITTSRDNGKKIIWFEQREKGKDWVFPAQVSLNNKVFQLIEYTNIFDIVYSLREDASSIAPVVLKLQDIRISS